MGGGSLHRRRPGLISVFSFTCLLLFSPSGFSLAIISFVSAGSSVSSPATASHSSRPSGAGRSSLNVPPASRSVSVHVSPLQISLDLTTDLPIFSSYHEVAPSHLSRSPLSLMRSSVRLKLALKIVTGSHHMFGAFSTLVERLSRTRRSIELRSVVVLRTFSFVSPPRFEPEDHALLMFKPRSESFTGNLIRFEQSHDWYPQAFQWSYPLHLIIRNQLSKLPASVSKETLNLRLSPCNGDCNHRLCSSPRESYKFLIPTVLNLFNKLLLWNVGPRLHGIAGLPDSIGLITSYPGLRFWQKALIFDRVNYRHRTAYVIGSGAMSKHTNSVSYGKKMAPTRPPDKLSTSFSVSGVPLLQIKAMKVFSSRTHHEVFCVQWHFIHSAMLLKSDLFIVFNSPSSSVFSSMDKQWHHCCNTN